MNFNWLVHKLIKDKDKKINITNVNNNCNNKLASCTACQTFISKWNPRNIVTAFVFLVHTE